MKITFRTAFLLCAIGALCVQIGCFSPQRSALSAQPDPAQVARLSAVAGVLAQTGASAVLANNPDNRAELLAIAEAIEQAAALPDAPPPANLVNVVSAAAAKFGGSYGALAGLGLQAGFAVYEQLYAANAASALDKQPAFRAVLVALASGIRSAASGAPASADISSLNSQLSAQDYVLRPAQ